MSLCEVERTSLWLGLRFVHKPQARQLLMSTSPFSNVCKHMVLNLRNTSFQYTADNFDLYSIASRQIPNFNNPDIRDPISIDGKTIMVAMNVSVDFVTKSSLKEAIAQKPSQHKRPRSIFARLGSKERPVDIENTPPKRRRIQF